MSPKLHEGRLTHRSPMPIDVPRARAQHAAYVDLLRAHGWRVVVAPALPELPDSVFVEDTAVVVGGTAIITRPGAPSRLAETSGMDALLAGVVPDVARIIEPGRLDGGDVLALGDAVYVGRSTRTDDEGIRQLAAIVEPLGRTVIPVDIGGCLHLKTAVSALPDGTLLGVTEWIDVSRFGDRTLTPAPEPSGANVLLTGGAVVVAATAPGTAELLRRRGFAVEVLDISEFEHLEAGLTCMRILVA